MSKIDGFYGSGIVIISEGVSERSRSAERISMAHPLRFCIQTPVVPVRKCGNDKMSIVPKYSQSSWNVLCVAIRKLINMERLAMLSTILLS